ncbi:MltA domain-containing protein [Xanthobacter sp.]|uniref:murein transglycosylase A n=1 Tax=Xanthobacter sp. TaxID=35809 RepID=UPI0025F7B123|nr:MltA domain-containing protein [Xanthobacter sp.]
MAQARAVTVGVRRAALGAAARGAVLAGAVVALLAATSAGAADSVPPASSSAMSLQPIVPAVPGARLEPVAFTDLDGWTSDDLAAAFATFRASCAALKTPPADVGPASAPTLRQGLRHACSAAARLGPDAPSPLLARLFFEANFRAWRVIPEGGAGGYYTGYYEPEVEGSLQPGSGFDVPVYGRPDDLVMTGPGATPNSGLAFQREGGTLVPYHDRAAIEDGALAGRGLEIVWLRDPVDLFFMQIQGSARVRLPDGRILRLGYDGFNGQSYLPVGRLLIQRGLVPREEMSMARIRAFMEADPAAGRALRRENPSFVFFKALPLGVDAGAMGAQGVLLTAGRSLAVDRKLHTYGTPIFVEADLPLSAPGTSEPFRRLMIAQDTGSAIVGPARADLFFGAGDAAGAVAGRIRHPGKFTMLVPRFAKVNAGGTP